MTDRSANENVTKRGVITAATETVDIILPDGCATVGLQLLGTWVATLEFEGTIDGMVWASVEASSGTAAVTSTTGNDIFILPGAGYVGLRVRSSAYTSGIARVTLLASVAPSSGILTGSLPAGENHMGDVGFGGGAIKVTPTIGTAIYAAGDAVGGLMTFANAARIDENCFAIMMD